jgi:hypothetical protein
MATKQVGNDRIFWQIVKAAESATKCLSAEFKELKASDKNEIFIIDLQDAIKELLIKHGLAE